jgi:heparinase II/III-like protein
VVDLARLAPRIGRAVSMSPHALLRKMIGKVWRAHRGRQERSRDWRQCVYLAPEQAAPGPLRSCFGSFPFAAVIDPGPLMAVTEYYLAHRFDLLGAGWIQVRHGMICRGIEGHLYPPGVPVTADRAGQWLTGLVPPASLAEAQRIWQLIEPGYTPLDWQLDIKSGYRWSSCTWYRDIQYGHLPGVDIKVPWELARMQHLPQLGVVACLSAAGRVKTRTPNAYAGEFRNQVLDFIATNPPRFGVNWTTTMDVAIRVANWLVAYDLFRAGGVTFDPEFDRVFVRSVLEHGRHIIQNLEWAADLRGNHYLANIVGLLFVAAYLPRSAETDAMLAFAVQEVIAETDVQFTADGANFEASTCYHRLSAELVVYAAALILGLGSEKLAALREYDRRRLASIPSVKPAPTRLYQLPNEGRLTPLPPWFLERVERMAEFTLHITKPDGQVPQIGDNDSGRFLKLFPVLHRTSVAEARQRYASLKGYAELPDGAEYWEEDHLDHRHLIAAVAGLLDRPAFSEFAGSTAESGLVRKLAGGAAVSSPARRVSPAERVRLGTTTILADTEKRLSSLPERCFRRVPIELPGRQTWDQLQLLAYPDFGLYLAQSSHMYLAIRCGSIGQNGMGGHAHNDQLHLELVVDGKQWITDPGTYVYTPLPEERNAYRSTGAHFTPRLTGPEPARLDLGLFRLGGESRARCVYWGPEGFAGVLQTKNRRATCIVRLQEGVLVVVHGAEGCQLAGPVGERVDWRALLPTVPLSPGYGITCHDASDGMRLMSKSVTSASRCV